MVKNRNFAKKWNFGQKSKLWSKIEILLKKSKFFSKIESLLKIKILLKKSKFCSKNRNFAQKSKFCSKIEILVKNRSLVKTVLTNYIYYFLSLQLSSAILRFLSIALEKNLKMWPENSKLREGKRRQNYYTQY